MVEALFFPNCLLHFLQARDQLLREIVFRI
jgi:hypothetical protein